LACIRSIHKYKNDIMKRVNSDLAYAYIRKRILNHEYHPGRPLMTKDLAADIGVSRTPVRDALRQLEAEGLVIIQAHLGASVKTMSFTEYRDICGMRLALESFAAGLAAENRTADELRDLKEALDKMHALTQQVTASATENRSAFEQLRSEDIRFHIGIISAAKNELLKKEVLRLHIVSRVVTGFTPGGDLPKLDKAAMDERRKSVQTSHEEIYHAIERGDAQAARLAMERHIQDIIDTNMRRIARTENVSMTRELSEEERSYTEVDPVGWAGRPGES
jgi:DNA-binding GntR family transcriptional regulator